MTDVEKQALSDAQIVVAQKIIEVVKPFRPEDVLTAMVSIMSHAINQANDPDDDAKFWARLLIASVHYTRENGDEPYSGGSIQ